MKTYAVIYYDIICAMLRETLQYLPEEQEERGLGRHPSITTAAMPCAGPRALRPTRDEQPHTYIISIYSALPKSRIRNRHDYDIQEEKEERPNVYKKQIYTMRDRSRHVRIYGV